MLRPLLLPFVIALIRYWFSNMTSCPVGLWVPLKLGAGANHLNTSSAWHSVGTSELLVESIHLPTQPSPYPHLSIQPASQPSSQPFVHYPISVPIHPSIHPSIYLLIHPPILFIQPATYSPLTYPLIHLSIHYPLIHPFTHPPTHPCTHPLIYYSIYWPIHISADPLTH